MNLVNQILGLFRKATILRYVGAGDLAADGAAEESPSLAPVRRAE